METYFVDVILPLHIPTLLTYRVPQEYNDAVVVGQRVVVQVGPKKLYSAVVRRIHQEVPIYKTKYILSIVDLEPIVTEQQLVFWEWMAAYYMCYVGDVMAIALPASMRLASESIVAIHPDFDGVLENLSKHELQIVTLLTETGTLPISDIQRSLSLQNVMPFINSLIDRKIVVMDEDLQDRFKPKMAVYLSLSDQYATSEAKQQLFDQLEKKTSTQKQLDVLMVFMQLSKFGTQAIPRAALIEKKELSTSAINTLIRNEVLVAEERVESRLKTYNEKELLNPSDIQYSPCQQQAIDAINADSHSVLLLHGVTSSGKTEVYIRLIHDVIQMGKQALFLLPEIALTAQLINRLRRFFGNCVGVYHSRLSHSERVEVWQRTLSQDPDSRFSIIIGARSALFLPYRNLSLIVVDEEHDPSYKQNDPSPRYQGRDSAIYLAHLYGARTILGSATPSIESYFNALQGKYGFAQMTERYGGIRMPEVLCADLKDSMRKKEMNGYFSQFLISHIQQALDNHQQIILFQNRRGFSLRIECDDCHWTPQCQNCDVTLVYHKNTNKLRCHYCGYSIPMPTECPVCHSKNLSTKGFGTERIEEDLALLFPNARIERMDLDTMQQKNRHAKIINDFDDGKIDILVGTQMVTKGLDFENVSVVGILSADNLIHFPDFRAYERAYQLMTQVSGRAGRHGQGGKVIIQAFDPYHQAIRDVIDNNYRRMFDGQIQERRIFRYPPYYRLIIITFRHRDRTMLDEMTAQSAALMRTIFGGRVIGPEYPSVSRVRNLYIKQIMVRFDKNDPLPQAKTLLRDICETIQREPGFKSTLIEYDVDPN